VQSTTNLLQFAGAKYRYDEAAVNPMYRPPEL
jgi:hypothetical protein